MREPGHKPLVVLTGAAGAIGSLVAARLNDRWQLRLTDLRPSDEVDALDVTDPDACRRAFAGADAVVHLAANPDPAAEWSQLAGPNIAGAYTVASATRDCAVPRLVVASSLQAMSGYPGATQRRSSDPPKPANLYGATKAWLEALGAWVATTSRTSVVALRIGYFAERPPIAINVAATETSAWLSHNDCIALVRAAVESPVSGLTIVNGISANRHRIAELGDAEAGIGYHPTDDAWAHI